MTVALYDGEFPTAYGVVSNISEAGACVVTDKSLENGRLFRIKISFSRIAQVFEIEARIVWCRDEAQSQGAMLYGLQFIGLSEEELERMKRLMELPNFRAEGSPGPGP